MTNRWNVVEPGSVGGTLVDQLQALCFADQQELAKRNEKDMLRIDMSEYMEKHSVCRSFNRSASRIRYIGYVSLYMEFSENTFRRI